MMLKSWKEEKKKVVTMVRVSIQQVLHTSLIIESFINFLASTFFSQPFESFILKQQQQQKWEKKTIEIMLIK